MSISEADLPESMMQILHKYASWERIEDIVNDEMKYYTDEIFDIEDLKSELGKLKKLRSDLNDYDADCKKSFHDVVEDTKHQILDKFPGIQYKETYNNLSEKYWVRAILQDRTVNDAPNYSDCECGYFVDRFSLDTVAYGRRPYRSCTSCSPPVVETDDDVEIRLEELYKELVTNRNELLEAQNLRDTSCSVYCAVDSFINTLERRVAQCEWQEYEKDNRVRKEWKEKLEEAKTLMQEKLQYLCTVMKEVLGDRVESVVVSSICSRSPCCFLTDSGMGRKIMEINPYDDIIEDLRKKSDAEKNDIHVRNAALVLFNYAELALKTMQQK